MPLNVAQKLIKAHLARGSLVRGEPIALRIDQTLTQDATGTFAMLSLEAMDIDRVRRSPAPTCRLKIEGRTGAGWWRFIQEATALCAASAESAAESAASAKSMSDGVCSALIWKRISSSPLGTTG
jgi:hypothetical protein